MRGTINWRRVRRNVLVATVLCAAMLVGIPNRASAASTVAIALDHTPPSGHNWSYKDFFPASSATVHMGDVVNFQWPTVPDGAHTATVLKAGETPSDAWNTVYPLAVPDNDTGDATGQLQFNPAIAAPSNPACGTSGSPCVYDGTADANSGFTPSNGTASYFVQMNVAAGTTVNFACLLHPGMTGSVTVVDDVTPIQTPAQNQAVADSEYNTYTAEGMAQENADNATPTSTTNSDGSKTWEFIAGDETAHVSLLEFFPQNFTVKPADHIHYTMHHPMAEIHTVTFPDGTMEAEPLQPMCEGDPNADTPDTAVPPNPPCGNPAIAEQHLEPAPFGPTAVASPSTVSSSGILGGGPGAPLTYEFSFPNAGSFTYMCHIHDHMTAVLAVQAANPSTTTTTTTGVVPVAATPRFTG